jgi:hypothetical protein
MSPKRPEYWLIWVGIVLMAFGAGGFIGFLAGRLRPAPSPPLYTRAEAHANNAEYLARRLTIGVSKLEKSDPSCRKLQQSHVEP